MKLTVGDRGRRGGFALPTILLISTVMLIILVASIAAAAASRVSLDSQYYNLLAKQAAESGIARANECLSSSGYTPQWATVALTRDLRPNSSCTGAVVGGASAYVVGDGVGPNLNIRTRYSIEAPTGTGIGSILQVVGTTELVRSVSPFNVWRSYTQSLYHRIEAPDAVACPENFIPVPGDSRFGTQNFCVSKYEAKNVGGKAASQADGAPYVNISQTNAITAAKNACTGCSLITEGQWLTIAHNLVNVSSNWSNGTVGSGSVYRGHSDGTPSGGQAASTDDTNGYFNTSNASGNQRRTLTLNNGEVIWDFSGNISEWTNATVSGAGNQPGAAGGTFREWNAIGGTGTLSPNPFPVFGTPAASAWTSTHGIGRVNSSTTEAALRGFIRGGNSGDNSNAGIFGLGLDNDPSWERSWIGFRIVLVPLSEITCSTGFIPVPGNALFGTNNFCVSKYEAKNVGGVATSEASGTPWTSISQTSAITSATTACSTCRLINESEWLTVAHNILNVPSNWTGGSVGSGTLYVGHSDGVPFARQAASSNDNDGYINTSNASGDQRRTMALNNGEIIWDFVGNVWEFTSGQTSEGQPGASGFAWREWNTLSGGAFTPNPSPVFGTPASSSWTHASQKLGMSYSSSTDATLRAYIRAAAYNDVAYSGLFALYLGREPSYTGVNIGFRVVEVK